MSACRYRVCGVPGGAARTPYACGHLPGVSDIQTRYVDVDEHLSEATRGPISAAAQPA
jgi:hypothetical protein